MNDYIPRETTDAITYPCSDHSPGNKPKRKSPVKHSLKSRRLLTRNTRTYVCLDGGGVEAPTSL